MSDESDLAPGLLVLARDDLAAAEALDAATVVSDIPVGFHALCGYPHKACYADLGVMPI